MNKKYRWFISLLVICLVSHTMCFAYRVTGTLGNMTCFYPKVYLAVINSIDGIYGASSQDIIASADLDSNGNFTLTGNDLPGEPRFYRLYVTSDKRSSVSIYRGSKCNYILLVLDNKSDVTINCGNFCKPFFSYSVGNSPDNEAIIAVQNILTGLDSLSWSQKWDSIGSSKKQFLENKRYADLKQFADTSGSMLAAIWAVTEMNIDSHYYNDKSFFNSFAERFRKKANSPVYARQLDEKLQLLQYKKESKQSHPSGIAFIIISILLGCSVFLNIYLAVRKRKISLEHLHIVKPELPLSVGNKDEQIKSLIEKLTIKEREILKMVNEGLSNKEIAGKLNVEVSTIKSHISSIYQKTDIKNRKEVAGIARYL